MARFIREVIKGDFCENDTTYNSPKVYLIYMFSIVGFSFTFILGLVHLLGENVNALLTNYLLIGSLFLVFNIYYLKVTNNIKVASLVILYLYFSLMVYLIYSGGIDNTGPLWIYTLAPVALFLHGFKRGLLDIFLFLCIISLLMFYPENILLETEYSPSYKIRIILSFIMVSIIASVYEYSRVKLYMNMQSLNKEIENISKKDQLTSLYNRRGYESKIQKMTSDSGVILMCDIDHFKTVNDTYGHHIGDRILIDIAKDIKENLRKDDIAVRWGGEEFFVFLPKINMNDAYSVAEKIRKSIEEMTIQYNSYKPIKITVSIGLAAINTNSTLEQTIKNADSAMYHAKHTGRNRTSKY